MAYLRARISIYLARKAQMVLLLPEEVSILKEYTNFLNVFFKESTVVLFECLDINKYTIDLKLGK